MIGLLTILGGLFTGLVGLITLIFNKDKKIGLKIITIGGVMFVVGFGICTVTPVNFH